MRSSERSWSERVCAGQLNGYRIDFMPNDRHSYLYMGDISFGSTQQLPTNTPETITLRHIHTQTSDLYSLLLLLFDGMLKSISNVYVFQNRMQTSDFKPTYTLSTLDKLEIECASVALLIGFLFASL